MKGYDIFHGNLGMKKFRFRFKSSLIVGLCMVVSAVLFWIFYEGRFDSYDMVEEKIQSSMVTVDLGLEPACHRYVPDTLIPGKRERSSIDIALGLYDEKPVWQRYVSDIVTDLLKNDDKSGESYCVRMYLPEQQQDELRRIFSTVDLLHDGVPAKGAHHQIDFGAFLVPIKGEPYVLTMYYTGPDENGYYVIKEFSIRKVRISRVGDFVGEEDYETRFFLFPELYDRLECFFLNLPKSSKARRKYDFMKRVMKNYWVDKTGESL